MASSSSLAPGPAPASSSSTPQQNIRNVCILAHVDHGKSSYADSLIAANNIISPRMAGKLRYLDSRLDEQERGITMKSSAVSLSYATLRPTTDGKDTLEEFKINLIDTPGHVDFTTEVSTASRLCDGALVLVDVVEGVCTQTISVLRQAWIEQLKPILVINKLDRLITELRLSPTEAYYHLLRLVEQVNAIMGSFFFTDRIEQDLKWREALERSELDPTPTNGGEEFKESDDQDIYFDPAKGDVLFASALDNWSFSIARFAAIWSKKLAIKQDKLERCLWGDFYFDPKSKMVLTKRQLNGRTSLKPMFVQFILDNLWAVYESVILNPDLAKTEKIIKSLELKIKPQDLRSKDTRNLLVSICSQWLPISTTTFRAIVAKIPDPVTSQSARLPKMLYPNLASPAQAEPHNQLERDLYVGKSDDSSLVVVYVSKMFAVPMSELPQFQRKQLTAEEMRERGRMARARAQAPAAQNDSATISITRPAEDDAVIDAVQPDPTPSVDSVTVIASGEPASQDQPANQDESSTEAQPSTQNEVSTPNAEADQAAEEQEALIGFARIYSGTIKIGQQLTCVLPKYNTKDQPEVRATHLRTVTIENLYMIMGRSLVEIEEVKAGHVFGIGGLEGKVLRNATLCGLPSTPAASSDLGVTDGHLPEVVNLAGVQSASAPIVRVSLEPKQPSDMPKLVEGLRLLNQSDPCVETLIQDTGEHVILTAGELHLERCLRDLRERFAKIRIQASKPIVPFRETAVRGADMPPPKTKDYPRGTIIGSVLGGLVTFTVRATPLPDMVTDYLIKNAESMRNISSHGEPKKGGTHGAPASKRLASTSPNGLGNRPEHRVGPHRDQDAMFWAGLEEVCMQCSSELAELDLQDLTSLVWAFGPRHSGPNLLLDKLAGSARFSLKHPETVGQDRVQSSSSKGCMGASACEDSMPQAGSSQQASISMAEFDDSIETAFQLATLKGPLCAEPVSGMCFLVEGFEVDTRSMDSIRSRWSQLTGELISSLQEAFKSAMLDWSPRLMLAMYTCEIQATTEVLGKVYGVVTRRKGVIKSEEIKDGTTFYTIGARVPIVESFGFNDELMKKTSGVALPQLIFDGFERIEEDPFWVPTTELELEELGEKSDKENLARKYVDGVRKRKGMLVEKKIVQFAEKQRTMKR